MPSDKYIITPKLFWVFQLQIAESRIIQEVRLGQDCFLYRFSGHRDLPCFACDMYRLEFDYLGSKKSKTWVK